MIVCGERSCGTDHDAVEPSLWAPIQELRALVCRRVVLPNTGSILVIDPVIALTCLQDAHGSASNFWMSVIVFANRRGLIKIIPLTKLMTYPMYVMMSSNAWLLS